MADQLHDWLKNSLLIGLFMICLIGFAVSIGGNYNKSGKDITGSAIDTSRIESSLNSTNTLATAWKNAFEGDSPLIAVGFLAIQSLWTTGISILNTILSLADLYLFSLNSILGVPVIVTATITTILIAGLLYLAYKFVRGT